MMYRLTVNGQPAAVDAAEDTPLLWALRDLLHLHGTKYGCGVGMCGACTVHLDGEATRSCQTTIASAAGKKVVTLDHEDIPGLMKAMTMEFSVSDSKVLDGLQAGDAVRGKLRSDAGAYTVTSLEKR